MRISVNIKYRTERSSNKEPSVFEIRPVRQTMTN